MAIAVQELKGRADPGHGDYPCVHAGHAFCIRLIAFVADVPIGGSFGALQELEAKLGIDLTSGFEPDEFTPAKL